RLDKRSQVDGRSIRKALDYLPLCFGRFFRRRGVGQQYMKLWCFLEDPGRENYEEIRCEISPVDLPDASYPCFDLHPLNIKGKPVSRPHLEFTGDPLLQRHFNHITTRPARKSALNDLFCLRNMIAVSTAVFSAQCPSRTFIGWIVSDFFYSDAIDRCDPHIHDGD